MRIQSLTLLAGATAVVAESTVSLFLPGFDSASYEASIVGTDGPMTAYALSCAPGTDSEDCGIPDNGFTVLQGPSSMAFSISYDQEYISEGCQLDGTVSATCTALQSGADTVYSTTITMAADGLTYGGYMPVVVTATGTANLAAVTGASPSAGTASQTATSFVISSVATPTNTGATTLSTATSSSSQTGTASEAQQTSSEAASSSSSNIAMPQMTGNARLAAGAAIAAALAIF